MKLSKSEILEAEFFFRDFKFNIEDEHVFFLKCLNTEYYELYTFFNSLIKKYGVFSIVGYGEENNIANRSQKIQEKLGFLNQNGFKTSIKNNVLNLKFHYENKLNYLSHFLGDDITYETFLKIINNKTFSIFCELIPDKDCNLTLKKNRYIGCQKRDGIQVMFGFDIEGSLYLIFFSKKEYLKDLFMFTHEINTVKESYLIDFLTHFENNLEKMIWVNKNLISNKY